MKDIFDFYSPVEDNQIDLFDSEEAWKDEWKEMPEFVQEGLDAYRTMIIRFSSEEEVKEFAKLIGQEFTSKTKSIWFKDNYRDAVKQNKKYVTP